jgi:hypothetical protein
VSFSTSPSGRGPTLMQSIGGLPSVQKCENEVGGTIKFHALITAGGIELQLAKI